MKSSPPESHIPLSGHATSTGELGKFAAGGCKKFASHQAGGTQLCDADKNMATGCSLAGAA